MYKEIKKQISSQTRSKFGFADIDSFKGIKRSGETIIEATQLPNPPNFYWLKTFYFTDRSNIVNGNVFYHSVPVYDIPIYAINNPSAQYMIHYYALSNAHTRYIATGSLNINGGLNGSFSDYNLKHALNAVYQIVIPGDGISSSVNLAIGSKDLSLSVWAKVFRKTTTSPYYTNETLLLYTSGLNGLVDSWANITVPVGEILTQIYVLVYNHSIDAKWKPGYHWNGKEWIPSGVPETSPPPSTDNFITFNADFNSLNHYSSQVSSNSIDVPSWSAIAPLVNTTDAITGNSVNILTMEKPPHDAWSSIEIYRKNYYENIVLRNSDNNVIGNNVILSTSDINLFPSQSKVILGAVSELIKDSFNIYANKIKNADFSSYTSGTLNLNNWLQRATAVGTFQRQHSTSYPYFRDYRSNGSCWKLEALKTNTAKSYYIETNFYVSTAQNDYLCFCYSLLSGERLAKLKALYFTSSNGTFCSLSSAKWFLDRNSNIEPISDTSLSSWNNFNAQLFSPNSDSYGISRPSDCKYFKFRFYVSDAATSYSSYLIDNFHVGEYSPTYLFDTSSINKIAVNFNNKLEKSRNYLTSFNTYFNSTTAGIENSTSYANNVFGRPQYITSSWDDYLSAKFSQGIRITSTAKNYFANTDFMGGGRYWSSSGGFNYSVVNQPSLFYATKYVRFIGGSPYARLSQTTGEPGMVGNSAFSLAVWAKSRTDGQSLRLLLSNTETRGVGFLQTSSSDFSLSSAWNKYQINKKFTAAGHTVIGRLIVPSGIAPWEVDVSGVQVEPKFISDFNYYSTVQGSERKYQGVQYKTATTTGNKFNLNHGTIRMWYTPLLDSDTGEANRTFFNCSTSTFYRSLSYDKTNQYFKYQDNGTNGTGLIISSASFQAGDKIHLVLSWDTSGAVFYINGEKSPKLTHHTISNFSNFNVGITNINNQNLYAADGIISNFRLDRSPWTPSEVRKDYNAEKLRYNNNYLTKVSESVFIGEKIVNKNDPSIQFIDDQGLEVGKKYIYAFRSVDENNYKSPESSEKTVTTKRKPFEYNSENKVANGSFEVLDYFKQTPLYWSSSGPDKPKASMVLSPVFHGKKSLNLRDERTFGNSYATMTSDYISISNTSSPYYLSWFNRGGTRNASAAVYFYDDKFNNIGLFSASANQVSTSYYLGADSLVWQRYSTSISKNNVSYATVNATKYWKIIMGPHAKILGTLNVSIFIDGIQVEEQTLRPYREGYFVGGNNLPSNSVDGNAIAFDSLVGRHFRAGEINVSGHSSDANRITIGNISSPTGNSYAELKSDFFRWHAPNMNAQSGWNYTKHVEKGINTFGEYVTFAQRYYNWNGTKTEPIVMITPYNTVIYSTAGGLSGGTSLSMQIYLSTSSAGGFVARAQIYKAIGTYSNSNFVQCWKGASTGYAQSMGRDQADGIPQWISTGLALSGGASKKSKTSIGTFQYSVLQGGSSSIDVDSFNMKIYATSQSGIRTLGATWPLIKEIGINIIGGTYAYSININHPAMARASAIAIWAKMTSVQNPANWGWSIDPVYMNYSTSSMTILKSDSQIGTYSWLSLDGGVMG